jgi:tetratricopeptide (TPR) repeat protein
MARLDRMETERELAQLAATLGREFSHEMFAAVADVDELTLQAQLAKLVQAEILYAKGRPPRCSYIFKHALLEDALYNALVKSKRQQLHRHMAEVLEARFPQTVETRPELLGHHFTEAGLAEKAVEYWLKAGLRSRERSAEVEAISHLTRGLELLNTLDESPERDARELELLNPLGTAYMAAKGYAAPEVGPVFRRARELCDRVGQRQQQFAIMWGFWAWHIVRGELRHSMVLADEAMEFAGQHAEPGLTMEALFLPGLTLFYRGEFASVRDHCGRAVSDYDDRERTKYWTTYIGQNAGVTHRCYLALALWHLGYPDQALKVDREMVELARTIGHPFSLVFAFHHSSWLHQHCRRGGEAQAAAEDQIRIASEQGFGFYHATGMLLKAGGLLLQGRVEEALPLLTKGLDSFRATGAGVTLPSHLSLLVAAYTYTGRFEDARLTLDEALAIADKNDDRCHEAELYRLKGELLLAESSDPAGAEQCFHQAIQASRAQQSRGWELRGTLSLARLWQRQGRRDEAREVLAAVYGSYTEGFGTPDLVDAASLLESLQP